MSHAFGNRQLNDDCDCAGELRSSFRDRGISLINPTSRKGQSVGKNAPSIRILNEKVNVLGMI